MNLSRICFLILCLAPISSLSAQSLDLFFEHFTTEDGLSQNDVNCIIQDSLGFMWFGTNDGLNRYDGYNVTEYKPSETDSFSISSNLINCLETDHRNRLWIGTTGFGISCFDPTTERFTNYGHDPNVPSSLISNQILDLHVDRKQRLWVGTAQGLNLFELTTDENGFQGSALRNITKKMIPPALQAIHINAIYQAKENVYWVLSAAGVFMLEDRESSRDYLTMEAVAPYLIATSIVAYNENNMILGGSNGLYWFDLQKRDPLTGRISPLILDSKIHSKLLIYHNEIWTASPLGLSRYGFSDGERLPRLVKHYASDLRDLHSLNKTVLRYIYADQNGLIWLGTNGGGVNKFDPEKKVFAHYQQQLEEGSLSNNKIRSVFEDSKQNLWLGTEGGGVNFLPRDSKGNDYLSFTQLDRPSYCFAINEYEEEGESYILVGGQSVPSLFKIKLADAEKGIQSQQLQEVPTVKSSVFALLNQDNRYVWIGTYSEGVFRMPISPQTGEIVQFQHQAREPHSLSSSLIRSLMQDSKGNIWIGTGFGLNLLIAEERSNANPIFKHFFYQKADSSSLSHDYILALHESKNGDIWIGTFGGGLNKYIAGDNTQRASFKRYNEAHGLPNNVVKGILEDDEGYLWISTNKGLSRFDPEKEEFHNYDTNDGLQSDEFSELAACKLQSGEMLFGGVNGFNVFRADSLYSNPHLPKVVFTSFQVLNTELKVGETYNDHDILPKAIPYTKEIYLQHDENSFSVEFSALHYSAPEKNQYAFKLENFQDEWAYVDASKRFATFTNLSPGTYTLFVKASNNDGLWNEKPHELKIIIAPPFWLTWWAFAFYLALLICLLWAFRRYTIIGIKEKHELVLEHLEKEKAEELQKLKLQFFTNISHELRTPLTLISGPMEYLLKSGKGLAYDERQRQYVLIRKNADYLLRLVNQLLDFRKLDQGILKLKVGPVDALAYVKEIAEPFQFIANKKNIDYDFNISDSQGLKWIDPDIVEKTLYNLLSNAFKFTPPDGKIEVIVKILEGDETKESGLFASEVLSIVISDSGPGIPEEERENIFDRFYKSQDTVTENYSGAGIGLAYTRDLVHLHHGTISVGESDTGGARFTVNIPIEKRAYTRPERIASGQENLASYQNQIDKWEEEIIEEKKVVANSSHAGNKPQILVVDDNADIRTFIKGALSEEFSILEAEDGQIGLKLATESLPDLILSDVMMPNMDGMTLCNQIKTEALTSHIPVILLTAKTSEKSEREGLAFGADDYIRKPFKIDILKLKIQNLLKLREDIHRRFRKEVLLEPETISVTSTDEIFLKKAMDLIEEHMTNPDFNVENMAQEIGVSRSKLYLKLKALTGQSSSEFIRTVRLKRAVQLLESSDLTVKEIMYMTGFNTASYFSKCFKKQFGIVPSEYVKQQRSLAG
ncbi:MAG: two-component regulator propeller domain-containing protein [Bacteroidota bacterium]